MKNGFGLNARFLSSKVFHKEYDGVNKELIELNFIIHEKDGRDTAGKYIITTEKLRKMLAYRGYKGLVINGEYFIWLNDWKGNRKFNISGIKQK